MHRHGNPYIWRHTHIDPGEGGGGDANDIKGAPVQGDRAPDYSGITAKFFPEFMAENHYWMPVRRRIFFR